MLTVQSNFLAIPVKRADPIPDFGPKLLAYISEHFRDAHPDAFRKDVDTLWKLRREFVEPKADAHPAVVTGLMRFVEDQ